MLREGGPERDRGIPVARSKFEAATRKVIGGGALSTWNQDKNMYRGGGNSSDALLLLETASNKRPGALLREKYSLFSARLTLGLPDDFPVPDGRDACRMKNFNNDATSGPFLRRFGVKKKYGLKRILEDEMWWYYDEFAKGNLTLGQLPHLCARLGYRSKLLTAEKALKRVKEAKPFGRAVMMMDALEQAASTPMYNVLSHFTFQRRLERDCGFKNAVIRASSDWPMIWRHVQEAKAIVELDWSKFDRERPSADLLFIVDVVCSCFRPTNDRERRLLEAYKFEMRSALVDRMIIMDNGGVVHIDGMVPSGSLWTGWVDTALNILYISSACLDLDIAPCSYLPMCAGDDNLTLFWDDPGDKLQRLRVVLNDNFRAGIDVEDFKVHRGNYGVQKRQATFKKGTDLSKGTSRLMKNVKWEFFDGELSVNASQGQSHRWEYYFKGKPKFLSFYWLPDGRPIRPARDNLEKLLWPEGIHKRIDDYMAAIASMVVDNPYNHHNVNHLLMRFIVCQQVIKASAGWIKPQETIWYAKFKAGKDEEVPFPMIAPWRRTTPHGRMEEYEEVKIWLRDFKDFVAGVTSLYSRAPEGGLDAYHYMDLIRGESTVGEGQFGNDLVEWLDWLHHHPMTRYFKPARGFRQQPAEVQGDEEVLQKARRAFSTLRRKVIGGEWGSCEEFAIYVASVT